MSQYDTRVKIKTLIDAGIDSVKKYFEELDVLKEQYFILISL